MRNSLPDSVPAIGPALQAAVRAGLQAAQVAQAAPGQVQDAPPTFCAGFSGGLDSTVLLHLLAATCQEQGWPLRALHVHHGLSPNAHAWEKHCATVCAELRVPLQAIHVTVNRAPRTSLEEEARRARHIAFAEVDADVMVLAQHADDQAETVLLQLLRGAGPKGLAGMPRLKPLHAGKPGPWLLRPLLEFTRAQLEAHARGQGWSWIEDESNQDNRLKRNFLRNRIMPVLREGFPAPALTFGRAARHQAEAAALLDDLADLDLAQAAQEGGLKVGILVALDDARLKNALRRWLELAGLRQPSAARLAALIRALRDSTNDTRLRWEHEGASVLRQKGILRLEQGESAPI